jgi:DNA (cytosine-5)-methyltransferase 1
MTDRIIAAGLIMNYLFEKRNYEIRNSLQRNRSAFTCLARLRVVACLVFRNRKFSAAVLAHHYPTVPNLGDMTMLHENETYKNESIDLLCGGTPCQSFSFAGLRKGLDDERGNLALHFIRILGEKRPTWFVWENVPGVLSSAGGRDFATILGGFTGRNITIPRNGWGNTGIVEGISDAYGIAWATLDAQYFGVPQRRRRIFVVGRLGDWHGPRSGII